MQRTLRQTLDDRRDDEPAFLGLDRAEPHLDRDHFSILAPADDVAAGPHHPGQRFDRALLPQVAVS